MAELRDAAVLVPVCRDAHGELRIVVVARADDGGQHGGQLGLPGGKPEPGDANMLATALREAIWAITGLIRVFPRSAGTTDDEPFALAVGATVAELADHVHHELGARCSGARVWGPSARFEGQRVGRAHVLADGDVVEVVSR